ncbi:MAG: hypothetical protein ACIAQF_00605 [Phycisphaerales bacterium JB065]
MSRTFPALYWDQAERLLWVALIGTTNETKSRVIVWRLEIERDAGSGALSVGSVARMQQEFTHKPASFGPMFIDAARFTLDDDRLVLNLYHHDRPKTRIEPEGQMKQSDESLERARLSQQARTTVQDAVRAEDEFLGASGPILSLEQSTDTVEVDGHRALFVIHRVANRTSMASGSITHGAWRGPGYAVSIVSTDESIKPETIWHARSPMMHFINSSSAEWVMADLAAVWWDEVEQCLWIGIGFGWSAEGVPLLSVHRLELERTNGEGGWKVADRRVAIERYSLKESQRDVEDVASRLLIRSLRFVRDHDGGVELEIEDSEGGTTTSDLPNKMREQPAMMKPPISELLVELIREDLAERAKLQPVVPDLRIRRELQVQAKSETPEVLVGGQKVRFVMHWVGGGTFDMTRQSWNGPGFALTLQPADSPEQITTLWYERSYLVRMSVSSRYGSMAERSVLWWDDERGELWIALVFTTSVGEQEVRVWRMRPDRTPEGGFWFVNSLYGNTSRYTADDFVAPNAGAEQRQSGPRVKAMRFVRADDGGVDLEIEYPEGSGTTLDLTRDLKPRPRVSIPPVSDAVEKLIHDDLAEPEEMVK